MAYTHRDGFVLGFLIYSGANDGNGYRLYQHVAISFMV